jgi:hypothetical protein
MVAGDAMRKSFSLPIPDPPKSLWGTRDKTQEALAQKAIGFTCLDYRGIGVRQEGALERHYLPEKSWLDTHCHDGLRLELMFPSCWNGEIDTPDHKSHLAYPDLVMEGTCPKGFTSTLPGLFYETIWNTSAFLYSRGIFRLSNGDPLGNTKSTLILIAKLILV